MSANAATSLSNGVLPLECSHLTKNKKADTDDFRPITAHSSASGGLSFVSVYFICKDQRKPQREMYGNRRAGSKKEQGLMYGEHRERRKAQKRLQCSLKFCPRRSGKPPQKHLFPLYYIYLLNMYHPLSNSKCGTLTHVSNSKCGTLKQQIWYPLPLLQIANSVPFFHSNSMFLTAICYSCIIFLG